MDSSTVFTVFPCGTAEWCACRADGLVCGYFIDQVCAIRFARRETGGLGTITVCKRSARAEKQHQKNDEADGNRDGTYGLPENGGGPVLLGGPFEFSLAELA